MLSSVFISYDYMMFFQDIGETDMRIHDTNHLTISLDGKMHCIIDGEIVDCYGYILNSQVEHQRCGDNADSVKLIFVFDPCSAPSISIKEEILIGKNYKTITAKQSEEIKQLGAAFFLSHKLCEGKKGYESEELFKLKYTILEIFKICGINERMPVEIDHRALYLIKRIREEEIVENEILNRVCSELFISKSRLLHIFKMNMGISLRRYMQYQKFFKTWKYIALGENITEACIHAGYSDSAHYSNFMNHCFGLSTKNELSSVIGVYCID